MNFDLGFLGAGNMAEAIARAALDRHVLPAGRMIAADPLGPRRDLFAALGIAVTADSAEVVARSAQVLLAVKPQSLADLAGPLRVVDRARQVLVSIMAGIAIRRIEELAGGPARVVRVMPNTPLLVGCGMAGIAVGPHSRPGDEDLALRLFGAAGEAVLVAERDIDAITAVSGSGPAYVFYLAEAMEQAALELGLGAHARRLVQQTILGAARLLGASGQPPQALRRMVTSRGGTTEAAVRHLDAQGTAAVFVAAIKAAHARSVELGQG
jgi:pyrroline-5-carboxylate reductase